MNVQVMGAGGWGLALARLLALKGHHVALWCRSSLVAASLRETRQRPELLPGVLLPPSVTVATETANDAEMAVLAVPSHAMRAVLTEHPLPPNAIRVSAAKGIENGTLLRMSEVIAEVAGPGAVVALSGPSHAEEVGRDLPASLVAACEDAASATRVQEVFMTGAFRVYTGGDIVGVELGGALKNVMAIAAGVCDGLELGDNAKAALITRGLAEIARLGVSMGAAPLTFAGLSGLGDLIVTCSSRHSRNRALGERIGRGETLAQVLDGARTVAEGVRTAESAQGLAVRQGVEMPITEQVCGVLYHGVEPRQAIASLMQRDAKPERG
ncbi:MAG: NAD(P)-dependent glycerol-3-phosphate dehydrogenase [Candidatus Hydrogenedentes bacterium]|nr:NAD(P)-dependent glycerol-3-phosphate dehydrogenase [Candidatus Hydrogenedentota bacterium]